MNRIRLLSEQVANQIAAGEVIERPASVIKELVENALDAGAGHIQVEVAAGGRSLMRVTDDGLGMSRDDALLCLERHATSKIQKAEDLAAITTLGFRGEALPSIASVSRMTLTTRERDGTSPAATQVVIHGGRILEVREAGAPPGTCVEVRNLFFNLPARRKFLRTAETETAHIQHYLTLAALAFPEVAFTFLRDGRMVWQLPAVKTEPSASARLTALQERMRALFGGETHLVAVDFSASLASPAADPEGADDMATADQPPSPASAFRVWGFIGAPGVSRATRQDQHVFVNRRPVESRAINFALLEGYHTALMKGRYPVCCLFLEMDPAAVDVNVHPAKREVKFHNEREVRRLVTRAVRETLLRFHDGGPGGRPPPALPVQKPEAGGPKTEERRSDQGRQWTAPSQLPLAPPTGPPLPVQAEPVFQRPADRIAPVPVPERPPSTDQTPQPAGAPPPRPVPQPPPARPGPAPAEPASSPTPLLNVPLRLVGVIGRLYVVLESDRGLVLLDQHAAHERVLFEQMLQRLERGVAPMQRLLLPETMELSPRDAQFVRELLPTFARLGLGLREFGEHTFLLEALPPFVKTGEPRRFMLDVIDALRAGGESVNTLRLSEHLVARTVCRHAVKAHDPLSGPELENLIADLRRCAMPYTCPHGRPTLIEISYPELEKKFGRQT